MRLLKWRDEKYGLTFRCLSQIVDGRKAAITVAVPDCAGRDYAAYMVRRARNELREFVSVGGVEGHASGQRTAEIGSDSGCRVPHDRALS